MYLRLFEDLGAVRTFSWGSAVLGYLYRELCTEAILKKVVSRDGIAELEKRKVNMGGALTLLQCWSWSRIPLLAPVIHPAVADHDDFPHPPYGARWIGSASYARSSRNNIRVYRTTLDRMLWHQFTWMPYSELDPEFGALLEHPEVVHPQLWMSSCPLIFYDRVEMYRPYRVLRQFGRIQHIPPHPTDHDIEIRLHSSDCRGAAGRDWARFHNIYVDRWHARLDSFVDYPFIEINGPRTNPGYYDWYERHTRRLISPVDNLDDIGFQVGNPILLDLVGNQLISMSLGARAVSQDDDHIYDMYQDNDVRMYAAGTQLLRRDTDSSNIPPIPPIPPIPS